MVAAKYCAIYSYNFKNEKRMNILLLLMRMTPSEQEDKRTAATWYVFHNGHKTIFLSDFLFLWCVVLASWLHLLVLKTPCSTPHHATPMCRRIVERDRLNRRTEWRRWSLVGEYPCITVCPIYRYHCRFWFWMLFWWRHGILPSHSSYW